MNTDPNEATLSAAATSAPDLTLMPAPSKRRRVRRTRVLPSTSTEKLGDDEAWLSPTVEAH